MNLNETSCVWGGGGGGGGGREFQIYGGSNPPTQSAVTFMLVPSGCNIHMMMSGKYSCVNGT